ncbi:MAG: DUF3098 domain-containing protein [Bacteroidales bacterium]|nr:DUF3098 domain-containing protein [Bacteroidales bacterium]
MSVKNTKTQQQRPADERQFAFGRENYKWVIIGLGLIVLGFFLMVGGNSSDPAVFSKGIFSFQRWTLAPVLILAGYGVGIYAIMKKPKD